MKLSTLLTVCLVYLVSGCMQKQVEPGQCTFKAKVGSATKLEGKWKLATTMSSGFMPPVRIEDHTCRDIIHEYTSDGKVIVMIDGVKQYEYNYEVERENNKITKINNSQFVKVTATRLTIDQRPVDGSLSEFYRVK